jgi:hypothetical protein
MVKEWKKMDGKAILEKEREKGDNGMKQFR